MIVSMLMLIASVANAQDANNDGCVDSYFDANTACVSVTASIGPDVSVGSGAVIAPRATLVGRVSASGSQPVGANTAIGRSATIGADQNIGSDNIIARSVNAGARLETLPNATVGYAADLGDDVFVGNGTIVGALVSVGNNTRLETGAVVARGTSIADSASAVSIAGIIGPNVTIGPDFDMASTARVLKGATIGEGVTILAGGRVGREVIIGDGVTIGANVRIGAGAEVTATSDVPDGTRIGRREVYDNPGVSQTAQISTLNFNGYTLYPVHLDQCWPGGGTCCNGTSTQQQMDKFCQDNGYDVATDWVVQAITSTECYCWGVCTGNEWASPCCSGSNERNLITDVTCESN